MGLFDGIEKFITEHGSSAILSQQLEFAKDRFSQLERKVAELQKEIGRLEEDLRRERADKLGFKEELKRLQKEHEEETVVHSFLDWKRGKRTQNKWMPFCPKCHFQADIFTISPIPRAICPACNFSAQLPRGTTIESILRQLPDSPLQGGGNSRV